LLEERQGGRFFKDGEKPLATLRIHCTTMHIEEGLILVNLGDSDRVVSVKKVDVFTGERHLPE